MTNSKRGSEPFTVTEGPFAGQRFVAIGTRFPQHGDFYYDPGAQSMCRNVSGRPMTEPREIFRPATEND